MKVTNALYKSVATGTPVGPQLEGHDKKVYNKLTIKTKANKRPTSKIKTIQQELKPIEVKDKQATKQATTKKEITKGGGY